MKKITILILALPLFLATHAATSPAALLNFRAGTEEPGPNANSIMVPIGNEGRTISLMELSHMNVKDFETLRGKKLGFFGKIGFKLEQKKLREKINADGSLNSKALHTFTGKLADGKSGFHLGGFALGFLGLLGVLIAYLINDEKKRNRVKWAWIGFSIYAVIVLLMFFVLFPFL
jgi:hypothetical protein